jgi:exonuclease VII large subunit
MFRLSANEITSPPPLKISASEAAKYYNQQMTVTGKVAQITIRPKVVYLNLDHKYPHSPLALVIFPSNTNQFGDLNALEGKNIEVKGKIRNYHNRPEIVLESTNQLKVIKE